MGGAPEFARMPRPVANGLSSGPQGEGRAPVFIVLERAVTIQVAAWFDRPRDCPAVNFLNHRSARPDLR